MIESYNTLKNQSEALLKEKGSKFIARAYPVRNLEHVKELLSLAKQEHSAARHWCYAYRLGIDGLAYRTSDDGEPSHSAGDPILREIDSLHLTNVLVVVIRYFGGVKLGVGGLIQAYGGATKLALEQNEVSRKEVMEKVKISFAYTDMSEVMRLIKKHDAEMVEHEFLEECWLIAESTRKSFKSFYEELDLIHTIQIRHLKTVS